MTVDPIRALDRSVRLIQDHVAAQSETIVTAMTGLRVRLAADEEALSCIAGRVALLATFESIARLGVQLVLDLPGSSSFVLPSGYPQAPLDQALVKRAAHLITPARIQGDAVLQLTLGRKVRPGEISLGGDDTTARVRVGEWAGGWQGSQPFGGGLAGAAAGAEVGRAIVGRLLATKKPVDPIHVDHRPFDLRLAPLALPSELDLGAVDFVSGGAITHAVLFLLFQVPGLTLRGRVFDDDLAQEENLNRYLLLTATDIGLFKVSQLADLSTSQIALEGFKLRVSDETSIAAVGPLAKTVCVGVDSVKTRWAAQRLAPGWLGVGATTHTLAMASEHVPGQACAACVHSVPEQLSVHLPTISFVSLMAGTLLAYRLVASRTTPRIHAEQSVALNLFNLAGERPLVTERLTHNPSCPLGCGTPNLSSTAFGRR